MLTEEQITTAAAVAKAALLAQGATLGFDEKTAEAAATSLAATLRVANKQAGDLAQTPLLRDDVVFGYVLTNVVAQQVAALTALVGKLLARLPNAKDDPEVAALLAGALSPEKVVERARQDMPAPAVFGPIEKCAGCQRSSPAALLPSRAMPGVSRGRAVLQAGPSLARAILPGASRVKFTRSQLLDVAPFWPCDPHALDDGTPKALDPLPVRSEGDVDGEHILALRRLLLGGE